KTRHNSVLSTFFGGQTAIRGKSRVRRPVRRIARCPAAGGRVDRRIGLKPSHHRNRRARRWRGRPREPVEPHSSSCEQAFRPQLPQKAIYFDGYDWKIGIELINKPTHNLLAVEALTHELPHACSSVIELENTVG